MSDRRPSTLRPPVSSIFLCYRRADSADVAGRIFDQLIAVYGRRTVFKDVDSIPFGVDFRAHVRSQIATCRVMLVVIGRDWLDTKEQNGRRRLDDPTDHVRIEIETALENENTVVIPVVVHHAGMPLADELPQSLRELAFRNGATVRPDPVSRRESRER